MEQPFIDRVASRHYKGPELLVDVTWMSFVAVVAKNEATCKRTGMITLKVLKIPTSHRGFVNFPSK